VLIRRGYGELVKLKVSALYSKRWELYSKRHMRCDHFYQEASGFPQVIVIAFMHACVRNPVLVVDCQWGDMRQYQSVEEGGKMDDR